MSFSSAAARRLGLLLAATLVLTGLAAGSASAKTHWLCRPGLAKDPCTPGLSTTSYKPDSTQTGVQHPKADAHPKADCFYVYPTVSDQKTTLANFHVDPVLRSIALYQAARYSQVCRVFAPTYRQVTLTALLKNGTETPKQLATGTNDVRDAFADYLKHDNHGRPFVLIGHSQGSFVLRSLIAKDVDTKPAVRNRMLSAILMGGNVLVKKGSDVGGDFKHVRACHSTHQLHCVVAFSTFDTPVDPDKSLFGTTKVPGDEVLCTNPAALGGGSAPLDSIIPSAPFYPKSTLAAGISLLGFTIPTPPTTWVHFPGAFTGQCSSDNGAHVLQITAAPGGQTPKPSPDATWGLHLLDANVGLGNLVDLVRTQAGAFAHGR
ncbi:MAG: hypothetical protein JWM71_265 [Solirubrobacteraceae bacterium]|nr:hypothetical protein [Solirubrobacteraceae bacterium]